MGGGRPAAAAAVLVLRRERAEPHKGKVEREGRRAPLSTLCLSSLAWLARTDREKATKRAS